MGFLAAANQFVPLLGERGLLPVPLFLKRVEFWDAPSLFWLAPTDGAFTAAAWLGVLLSALALTGLSEAFGILVSSLVWFLLWLLYLSFVNVGQVFYGFGWETLLLESGFLAIFLGSRDTPPPQRVIWFLRWVVFRLMFGAGLIKLRGDPCWRDLTCMMVHYETQPVPNPLSWYFHHLPPLVHRASVALTHFVELAVPFGVFGPGWAAALAGFLMVVFQLILILSGNLSWLNYLSIALCVSCFDDRILRRFIPVKVPETKPMGAVRKGLLNALTVLIIVLSIQPTVNLLMPWQLMNASFDPLHLVNTYGAFGSVTKERNEIIFEGAEEMPGGEPVWKAYEFKCKPGDVGRTPCVMSPYHYRLDWLLWFAAMSDYRQYPWILNLAAKLLQNDPKALSLLKSNPFPGRPPKFVRAEFYRYRFTSPEEKKKTGRPWRRVRIGGYLPVLSLDDPRFRKILEDRGWLP